MEAVILKACKTCGESKPDERFRLRSYVCRKCEAKKSYQRRKRRWQEMSAENPEALRALRHKEREQYKINAMRRLYGMTPEDYTRMYEAQGGKCAICFVPRLSRVVVPAGTYVSEILAIDHCHSTNRVRGLLCHSCNLAIGLFSDSAEKMQSAIRYLAKGAF